MKQTAVVVSGCIALIFMLAVVMEYDKLVPYLGSFSSVRVNVSDYQKLNTASTAMSDSTFGSSEKPNEAIKMVVNSLLSLRNNFRNGSDHKPVTSYKTIQLMQKELSVPAVGMLTFWPLGLRRIYEIGTEGFMYNLKSVMNHLNLTVIYATEIKLTPHGLRGYVMQAYGNQNFAGAKFHNIFPKQPLQKKHPIVVLWIGGIKWTHFKTVRDGIRTMLDPHSATIPGHIKDTVHVTDDKFDTRMLSEVVLSSNSLDYLNQAKGFKRCFDISQHLASAFDAPFLLPGFRYSPMLSETFLVDSGSVLDVFELRSGTDIDLVFDPKKHPEIRQRIMESGHKLGDHGTDTVWFKYHSTSVDELLMNEKLHFYCFGIKFVSPGQVILYKMRRNEVPKDVRDVALLQTLPLLAHHT